MHELHQYYFCVAVLRTRLLAYSSSVPTTCQFMCLSSIVLFCIPVFLCWHDLAAVPCWLDLRRSNWTCLYLHIHLGSMTCRTESEMISGPFIEWYMNKWCTTDYVALCEAIMRSKKGPEGKLLWPISKTNTEFTQNWRHPRRTLNLDFWYLIWISSFIHLKYFSLLITYSTDLGDLVVLW